MKGTKYAHKAFLKSMMKLKYSLITVFLIVLVSSCNRDPLDRFTVVYEVEFVSTWSSATHPTDFPANAHFSPFVAVSHLPNSRLFIEGLNASEGLKDVAETGNTSTLEEELQLFVNTGEGLDVVIGDRVDSPSSSAKIQLGMREGYSTVTALSMVAPSPDWFVATTTNLLDPSDGLWYDQVTSNVLTYDAGTDSGVSFTSVDSVTTPVDPVSFLDEGPLTEGQDTVVNMGYFVFTRIK